MAEERAIYGNSSSSEASQKSERRIFKRYPLSLTAKVINSLGTRHDCEMRDFCVGGMLLIDSKYQASAVESGNNQFSAGEVIEIHSSVVEISNPDIEIDYVFIGRIVRQLEDNLGISFIDPDAAAIQGLMNYAEQLHQLSNSSHAEMSERKALLHADILAECTAIVIDALDPLIESVIENTVDELFKSAKETVDVVEQNNNFEAMGIINDMKGGIIQTYREAVVDRIANYIPGKTLDYSENNAVEEISLDSMSIIDDNVLDDWLADTGTIESVEREYKVVLSEIEKRLSVIYGIGIERASNPFGPALFSHSFQDTIHTLDLKHKIEMVWYKTFKESLTTHAAPVYADINNLLIDYDILPQLKYEVSKEVINPKREEKKEQPNETIVVNDNKPESTAGVTTASEINSVSSNAGSNTESNVDNQNNTIQSHDLYELMDELKTLKKSMSAESPVDMVTNEAPSSAQATEEVSKPYSQNEILHAISDLKDSHVDRNEIRQQLKNILSNSADAEGKSIGKRESRIVDLSGQVFDNLLDDELIPDNMRGWISELELPVLKMAITDDELYKDRDNLVRQVVNKIAKLGLLVGEEETVGQSGIRNALDWLVNMINSEYDGSEDVFERVSGQLDLLIKAQDSKYTDNIKNIISTYKSSVDETPDYELSEDEFSSEDELELWKRKAKRLEEGTWVLFDAKTDSPKHLRAGWIASHTEKVIFVNLAGERDRILNFDKLASVLHSGDAVLVDDANEPAMDRAQYSMLQDMHQQLMHESTHDPLTGLINRREFEKRIGETLTHNRHEKTKSSLCFIDFDQFNVINTTCGYEAGDKLLTDIAKLLADVAKGKGTIARLGGDEFGLLLDNATIDDSLDICEDIIQMVREHKFIWNDKRITTAISIGMVSVYEKSESITSLMQSAQSSCSIAKEMGGNRVQLYREGHDRQSQRSEIMSWMSQIDDILDEDRLRLRCQRIQPLYKESSTAHYEVLLALTDSKGVPVSIQDFVQAAEWGNRITDIDRWVVTNTLKWISENMSVLENVSVFSINLSGRSLSDPSLVDFVLGEIQRWNVPPSALCFEITETAGVENLSDTADFINKIKESGCRFSLDDFGSGMSSYAYLKNLPVDYIKIDGVFVKDIAQNISDYAVVKSICEIGHFMGKRVIAEFVEDVTTINILKDIGVDYAQGFGVEKPRALDELLT